MKIFMVRFSGILGISALAFWTVIASFNFTTIHAAEQITLRYSEISPPKGNRARSVMRWNSEVEKQTAGRVKIEMYWSQALLKGKENIRGTKQGIADLSWVCPNYNPSEIPLWTFMSAVDPFKDISVDKIYAAIWKLYDNTPALHDELAKWNLKLIAIFPYPAYDLWSNKKINSLDDIKGLKVRVSSDGHAKIVRAVGGSPVFISGGEMYTALQKGTVDAMIYPLETAVRYSLHEVVKYWIPIQLTPAVLSTIVMNLDKWKKLPQDIRQIMAKTGREITDYNIKLLKTKFADMRKKVVDSGVECIELSKSDKNKWSTLPEIKQIRVEWIEDMNKRNLSGKKVLDKFLGYLK